MEVKTTKSFIKDYKKAPAYVQTAANDIITKLVAAISLEAANVDYTKMEGQKKDERFYRIRIGEWRIGLEYISPSVTLLRLLNRGKMYNEFPPGAKK